MANDLATFDQLQKNNPDQLEAGKPDHVKDQYGKGTVVFRKDTGMAFEVRKESRANGIEHFNLLCRETGSRIYLSKFALEKDYVPTNSTSETGGLRIVKRLSELLAK